MMLMMFPTDPRLLMMRETSPHTQYIITSIRGDEREGWQ